MAIFQTEYLKLTMLLVVMPVAGIVIFEIVTWIDAVYKYVLICKFWYFLRYFTTSLSVSMIMIVTFAWAFSVALTAPIDSAICPQIYCAVGLV